MLNDEKLIFLYLSYKCKRKTRLSFLYFAFSSHLFVLMTRTALDFWITQPPLYLLTVWSSNSRYHSRDLKSLYFFHSRLEIVNIA